jgi:hypothetical protein
MMLTPCIFTDPWNRDVGGLDLYAEISQVPNRMTSSEFLGGFGVRAALCFQCQVDRKVTRGLVRSPSVALTFAMYMLQGVSRLHYAGYVNIRDEALHVDLCVRFEN